MRKLPALLGIIGAVLFVSALAIPANATSKLSLLVAGGLIILTAYALSMERAFREEVKILSRRASLLEEEVKNLLRDKGKGEGA